MPFDMNGAPGDWAEPGKIIDIRMPIWRVAECLDHARIVGALLGPDLQVLFRARWYGLAGRRLSSLDPMQAFTMRVAYTSRQDEFAVQATIDVVQTADSLPEVIFPLLAPFYENFRWFRLTMDIVRNALAGRTT